MAYIGGIYMYMYVRSLSYSAEFCGSHCQFQVIASVLPGKVSEQTWILNDDEQGTEIIHHSYTIFYVHYT